LSAALGGVIAGTIGFLSAWWKRWRDGRDRFLAVVSEVEAELDDCEHISDRTQKVHASSLIPLRTAIFAVKPFVSECSFNRLMELWHSYKKEQTDARTAVERLAAHDLAGRDMQSRPSYPDDMMRSYLNKFRKEVG
jgi:hypothetical protein